MRSQLTRHVLRRLHPSASRLAAAAQQQPQCLLIATRPVFRTYPVGCRVPRTPTLQQRRTFLGGLFKKEPRRFKDLETDPGYETMLLLHANRNEATRLPSDEDLVKAWRAFFTFKATHKRTVNSTQAFCADEVLRYLEEKEQDPDNAETNAKRSSENEDAGEDDGVVSATRLSRRDLRLARDYLSISPTDAPRAHVIFARNLYTVLRRRQLSLPRASVDETWKLLQPTNWLKGHAAEPDFLRLIVAFSSFGNAVEAKDMLLKLLQTGRGKEPALWRPILQGLANENRMGDAIELIRAAEQHDIDFDRTIHGVITSLFAKRDMVTETKYWWSKPILRNEPPSRATYFEVLLFAMRNNEQEWAGQIYEDLVKKLESGDLKRHKALWDVAFQWAVLLKGKGPEHIEHMFTVCRDRVAEEVPQPDIESINRILQAASEKDDPYLGERFITLAEKMGFEKNEQTVLLQIEYRMRADDLDGAVKAFRYLGDDATTQSFPVLNKLIRKLGDVKSPDYDKMLEITSFLEQRRATLEPDTVVSICMAFLRNDEQFEVIDTLSLHTAYYSVPERATVAEAFVQYCLDRQNSTARVWDAYSLLRQFFPELVRRDRIRIMRAFFGRRRADMACHVFGHMRAHPNMSIRPTVDDYVAFFEGIGLAPDYTSLKIVHNMWRMDTTTQPNTELYNALMVSYIACDMSYISLEFWKEITVSVEGPSYESLHLVFMAYEITPGGDEPAMELWEKIQKMEIEVPAEIYGAYVAAIAAHGNLEQAKTLLLEMQGAVGKRPDSLTLAVIHNTLQSGDEKKDFIEFAKREFTPAWRFVNDKFRRRRVEGEIRYLFERPWKLEMKTPAPVPLPPQPQPQPETTTTTPMPP